MPTGATAWRGYKMYMVKRTNAGADHFPFLDTEHKAGAELLPFFSSFSFPFSGTVWLLARSSGWMYSFYASTSAVRIRGRMDSHATAWTRDVVSSRI